MINCHRFAEFLGYIFSSNDFLTCMCIHIKPLLGRKDRPGVGENTTGMVISLVP